MDTSKKPRREVSVEGSLVFTRRGNNATLLEANGTKSEFEEASKADLVERSKLDRCHIEPIRIRWPTFDKVVLKVMISCNFGVVLIIFLHILQNLIFFMF